MGILKPPASGVTIRMYRQGLGDCFLLAFPTISPEQAFYMLIDCGVIPGTEDPVKIMTDVAKDIEEATGGDIHLLVVTHEHWDHVSGFVQAAEIFSRMRIHNLWLAWTENPSDELAQRLRAEFRKMREALRMAVKRAMDSELVEHITNLLHFYGEPSVTGAVGRGDTTQGAIAINDTESALEAIRNFASKMNPSPGFRYPGEGPLPLPDVPGVRLYVLGPPHDEQALKRMGPIAKKQEVSVESFAPTAQTAFIMALQDETVLSTEERELHDLSFPFDQGVRIPRAEAEQSRFFQTHYGFDEPAAPSPDSTAHEVPPRKMEQHKWAWRRIDDDWLEAAGELALQLDSYTNNTCLVLAIELVNTKKVLLFVADAQLGSWLSWDELSWPVKDATGATRDIRIGDLFTRTVLYKVGHHGSSNATLLSNNSDKKGLELMTSSDLVAMLPVDHTMAVKKHWNKMPFDPLVRRLEEKTNQRIMRIDDAFPKLQPDGISDSAWQAFKANFDETPLYIQYTVTD